MAGFDGRPTSTQQPAEGHNAVPDHLNLFSFGSEAEGWKRGFREIVLWSLILASGCRPFLSNETDHVDLEPQRGIPTAPLNPGSATSPAHNHRTTTIYNSDSTATSMHEAEHIQERTTLPGYEAAWNSIVDRYEPILVKDINDRIVLELMLLTEPQIKAMLQSHPSEKYPQEEIRIRALCDGAVEKGYAQRDVAECALQSYFLIKARALCTDMLEVQLSGAEAYLSDRVAPIASAMEQTTDDPIYDTLRLLTSMSESILLKANEQGVAAQDAASRTHPGTVMARDLARMLVDPQSLGARTRGDLEKMADITLATYSEVTNDGQVSTVFNEALARALDAVLARRATLVSDRLTYGETEVLQQAAQSNLLVHFDIDGDGHVTRLELAPLEKRYNVELIEALQPLPVPIKSSDDTHKAEH
jgi:hypothetical protein